MAADPFAFLGTYFDRVLVLTLARAQGRQARMRERLAGLRFEFLHGFDARAFSVEDLVRDGAYDPARARAVSRVGKALTPGELGAALSHRRVYEDMVRQGWHRALVFEDDVVPRPEALREVEAALGELPPDWDLVYLGHGNYRTVTRGDRVKRAAYLVLAALRLMKWTPAQVLRLLPAPHSPHLQVAGLHHGAYAYGISAAGARRLLEAQTPCAYNADQLLAQLVLQGKLRAFVTRPRFFDHEEAPAGEPATYVGHGDVAAG